MRVVPVGSSTSRRRKGPREAPTSGEGRIAGERQWEHETRQRVVFGSPAMMVVMGVVLVFVLFGLLFLTL